MQFPCNALGLLSKKQYASNAEIRFMIKLLTNLWRECTICAVFFSMSLMVSIMYLLRSIIAFVSEQLAIQTFSKNLEHIRVLVADICTSKYKRYYLASVIARKGELKAMAPTHCSFSVCGNSLEYLIGISPEIMAYEYHRGIDDCYADTSSESSQIKENMSWKNTRLSYSTKRLYDTAFGKYDFIIPLIKNR